MSEYLVIFEQGKDGGWGAFAPDLPGLGVASETREEVSTLIREGMALHIASLKEDGLPIPEPGYNRRAHRYRRVASVISSSRPLE